MMNGTVSSVDLCRLAFDMLVERGCKPMLDENEPSVACAVNGAELLIGEVFGNTISFEYRLDLGREASPEEKEAMQKALDEQDPVIFEALHIYGRDVELCTLLPTELIRDDVIEDFISAPDQKGGIVEFIKSMK